MGGIISVIINYIGIFTLTNNNHTFLIIFLYSDSLKCDLLLFIPMISLLYQKNEPCIDYLFLHSVPDQLENYINLNFKANNMSTIAYPNNKFQSIAIKFWIMREQFLNL